MALAWATIPSAAGAPEVTAVSAGTYAAWSSCDDGQSASSCWQQQCQIIATGVVWDKYQWCCFQYWATSTLKLKDSRHVGRYWALLVVFNKTRHLVQVDGTRIEHVPWVCLLCLCVCVFNVSRRLMLWC